MSMLVADCPRCGAKQITFDIKTAIPAGVAHKWQNWFEAFCICRRCRRSTTFRLSQKNSDQDRLLRENSNLQFDRAVNDILKIEGYVSQKDRVSADPPEHLPMEVEAAFREGATCLAVQCWNAAGTMFRMCVDLATRPMLPAEDVDGLNRRTRRDLGLRLPWLFDHGLLPESLRDLATCIREDGNDGAHAGTLTKADAEDLLDFTQALLERIFTEPRRLALAEERRRQRRAAPAG